MKTSSSLHHLVIQEERATLHPLKLEHSQEKQDFIALFQKKNLSEEVFTDMLSSLASLYKDEDTTDMLVVMRTVEHFFSMHKWLVGFY